MKPALRLCLPAILVTATALLADVRTPTVFGPNMVFQQGRALPVWGWAEAGEKVTVALAGKQTGTTANAKGEWRVDLPTMTTATGLTLTIQGTNTLSYPNVAVGEVWLGSGQSNMQWTVSNSVNPKEEIAAANFPEIRLYYVPRVPAGSPQTDVKAEWKVCTPETVPGFSAALYFFGRELHKELRVPLGLIHTSWGGTRIEPWTPPNGFAAVPALKTIHDQVSLSLPHTAVHKEALGKHLAALDGWVKATRAAADKNLSPPPMPAFNNGLLPLGTHTKPTGLYNGMVHALIPFAIRGAIWYQGESNRNDGEFYFEKMKALILGWRELWSQGDFPFYFVQLAPYRYGGSPTKLAEIWMGQTKSLAIPNTGMAVTLDIGNVKDIHPRKKQQVGRRLALWALAKDYGKDVVYSGPMFRGATVEGKAIRLTFDHLGGGLVSRDGEPLTWFEIIGKEGEWKKAEARIDGEAVVVSSADIPQPCAVRFAWHQLAEPNLMNKAGLPAPAFVGGKPPVFTNLALNKPFTSSDPNAYGTSWRLGLTDGNWGSDSLHCFASSSTAAFPKYATIDLGEAVSVNRVVFGVPNFGSTKDVKAEISTGGKIFHEVGAATFTLGKGERKTIRFPLTQARYVRLAYKANHETKKGYDANFVFTQEVEVYGPVALPTTLAAQSSEKHANAMTAAQSSGKHANAMIAPQSSKKYANAMIWAKPLTNPVYNDFAMIKREVNILYAYQTLPSHIDSTLGPIELDGDANVFAIQAELPLTESLSLVANKSGFTDLNPEATLTKQEGMNDLSTGLKWAFLSCENYTLALRATVELPIGNTDVLQGNGDGNISPALIGTYLTENNALNAVVGAILPFDDDEESTMAYASIAHAYRLTEWMSTHLELNWFSVLESGNGDATFENQIAGAEGIVPAIVGGEGGDLINLGAPGSDDHRDAVSAAIGARFQLHENISLGLAFEVPLTRKENGLMGQRFTAHLTATF